MSSITEENAGLWLPFISSCRHGHSVGRTIGPSPQNLSTSQKVSNCELCHSKLLHVQDGEATSGLGLHGIFLGMKQP